MSSDPFRGYGFVMAPSAPDAVPASVTLRGGAAKWLTAFDLAEMLYGAVVTAAVLAVVSTHTASVWRTFVAGIVTLLVYWAAHVYTRTLGDSLAHPVQSWWEHVRGAAVAEVPILRGGAPPLVIFGLASAVVVALVQFLSGHLGACLPSRWLVSALRDGFVPSLWSLVVVVAHFCLGHSSSSA